MTEGQTVRVSGRPNAEEVAAVLAVLAASDADAAPDPQAVWRHTRREALRRTVLRS